MDSLRLITQIMLFSFLMLAGIYDFVVALRGETEATISKTVWDASTKYPIIPFLAGMLAAHLFFAQHVVVDRK